MPDTRENSLLMSVRELKKVYPLKNSALLSVNRKAVHAVDGISFNLYSKETLGLVGESGCGKSTVGRLVVGIEKPTAGEVYYKGENLAKMPSVSQKKIRTKLQMIFQDSYSSLNPRKRIYELLAEPMLYHRLYTKETVGARIDELLDQVGLSRNAIHKYPHEFSGGQRQRISIAKALSLNPNLIVCDEPVSALDMSIQAQILNLLKDLQKDLGLSFLFIAHSLGAVHYISEDIAVMYLGKIVEMADSDEIFKHPLHPYAKLLISSVPLADPTKRNRDIEPLEGEVPSAIDLTDGCRFAMRCPFASDKCQKAEPDLINVAKDGSKEHLVACWLSANAANATSG